MPKNSSVSVLKYFMFSVQTLPPFIGPRNIHASVFSYSPIGIHNLLLLSSLETPEYIYHFLLNLAYVNKPRINFTLNL